MGRSLRREPSYQWRALWLDRGDRPLGHPNAANWLEGMHVEFNLSAASIGNPDVIREIESQLQPGTVDPSLLVVEITETAMLDHPEQARALAAHLASLGCGLALDDFGTGFASLSMLKRLPGPVPEDRSGVRAGCGRRRDRSTARAGGRQPRPRVRDDDDRGGCRGSTDDGCPHGLGRRLRSGLSLRRTGPAGGSGHTPTRARATPGRGRS